VTDVAEADPAPDAATLADDDIPTETKGERTRRRLLELAIERFGARGYRATSVSEIARLAGVTQAATYAYYASKEDLFVAAVDTDAEDLINEAHDQVRDTPIRLLFPAFIVMLIAGLENHPLAKRVLSGQEPDAVKRLRDLPALRHFADLVEVQMREAQATGEIRADIDPAVLIGGIETIVVALLYSSVQSGGEASVRAQIGVVEAFDAMLRPPS
jgi:AcrR family transcriptional regulator